MRIKLSVVLLAFVIPVVAAALFVATATGPCDDNDQAPKQARWVGAGKYRVSIVVPAAGTRPGDHRPALVALDLGEVLGGGPVHIAAMQLIQYDPESGAPLPGDPVRNTRSSRPGGQVIGTGRR